MHFSPHVCSRQDVRMSISLPHKNNGPSLLWVKALFVGLVLACLLPQISSPIALIAGFAFRFFLGHPFEQWNKKAVSWLLKIAVVGLGFGMNLSETLAAGKDGIGLTAASIGFILVAGYFLGRFLKIQRETTHLISSGTAICGGSAIAAVAPVIRASEKDISIALGVIFLLNSVALLIFPSIGHFMELSQHEFGLWSAIAIHDTSSVVGAAHAFGDEALQVATTVKLARVLWIIPISFLSMFLFKGDNKKVKIPWFILLFVGAILVNTYLPVPEIVSTGIPKASKALLVLTLFLVGAGLSIDKIKAAGWKPMALGLALWVMVSALSLWAIQAF